MLLTISHIPKDLKRIEEIYEGIPLYLGNYNNVLIQKIPINFIANKTNPLQQCMIRRGWFYHDDMKQR